MWSWNPKCKGRVVLLGDIVKDDSGAYAVLAEQGSSVSQIIAAKIMHVMQDYQVVLQYLPTLR